MNSDEKSFKVLGLSSNILKAINDSGYTKPTDIQIEAIPAIIQGSDIIAVSQTGTGKTASFALPLLHMLSENTEHRNGSARALIIVPTRELAIQVGDSIKNYSSYLKIKTTTVLGSANNSTFSEILISFI